MNINEDVKEFFNRYASHWDDDLIINEEIINRILDDANVKENGVILDVATGTGVLIPFYLKRNVNKIDAVDVSDKMIEVAKSKFNDKRINFICDDVFNIKDSHYDSIVVYNAFPHFKDGEALIKHLYKMLNNNGRLVIAHGASRDKINNHHSGSASNVSNSLMTSEELKTIMSKYLNVANIIDNDLMYEVCGEKR